MDVATIGGQVIAGVIVAVVSSAITGLVIWWRSRPRVEFVIEYESGDGYILRNTGRATADGICLDTASDLPTRLPADGFSLAPGQGERIMLFPVLGLPVPPQLWVTWTGHPERVAVPVPRKPAKPANPAGRDATRFGK